MGIVTSVFLIPYFIVIFLIMTIETFCRICGYFYEYPIRGVDGQSPSYEICPCCGCEFGVDDYTIDSVRAYRSRWIIEKSASWFDEKRKPAGWDFFTQLSHIHADWI